jgi:hypothetical protein
LHSQLLSSAFLRSHTTERDIAFLLAGSQAITFPETLSEQSLPVASFGNRQVGWLYV